MTRVLDRYAYRELLPLFLLGVGLFTFLHVMDRIQDFINFGVSGAPFGLVLRLWLLLVLSFLSHTLPMGLLLAVVMAAGRFAADLEVVALTALGVSPLRLFRPFFVFTLGVTLLTASLTLWINPWGHAVFFRLLGEVQQRALTPLIQARTFTQIGALVIYAEEVALATGEFRGVLVSDEREPQVLRIAMAPHGRLVGDAERRRIVLRLADGAVHESHLASPGRYRVTAFGIYDASLDVGAKLREARALAQPERDLTTWDLVSNTRALEWTRSLEKAEMFVREYHRRLTFPASAVVFVMLGFPLGVRLYRGGQRLAAVAAIGLILAYHVTQETLGSARALRPWGMGRWAPVVLFGLGGAVLLYFTVKPAPAVWRRAVTRLADLLPTGLSPSRPPGSGRRRPGSRPRRRPSYLVDRYLVRQFLVYLGYGLAATAAVFIVVDLLETLSRYLPRRPPALAVLEHFAYRVPVALHQALPFIVLAATVFLFLELSRYHELTALKVAGMSVHRISLPVLLVTGALSAGAFLFQETALPFLNASGDEVDRVKIRGEPPRRLKPQPHLWYRRSDGEFLRVELLDPTRRQLDGITVLEVDASFRVVKRLDLKRAVWSTDGWTLAESVLREFGPDSVVRAALSNSASARLPESFETLAATQTPPTAMTYGQLRAYVRHLQERGHKVGGWILLEHAKLAFPLMNAVLALLAVCCATRWAHGGRLIGAAIALTVGIAYSIVNSMALSFGRADLLPPIVAAWAANVVFGGIGVALFLRSPT
jgi:lipopolysaccharide export system permease protein